MVGISYRCTATSCQSIMELLVGGSFSRRATYGTTLLFLLDQGRRKSLSVFEA